MAAGSARWRAARPPIQNGSSESPVIGTAPPTMLAASHAGHVAESAPRARRTLRAMRLRESVGGGVAREGERQHASRIEARVDLPQVPHRPDHEARGGREHERERDLGDDKHALDAMSARTAARRPPSASRSRRCAPSATRVPRRTQRQRERRERRERAARGQSMPTTAWRGRSPAMRTASNRDQRARDQRCPATPPADARAAAPSVRTCRTSRDPAGAERAPDRKLPASRSRAREQQVRDVDARDEQHEADGAEQHQQCGPHVADEVLAQRHTAMPLSLSPSGIRARARPAMVASRPAPVRG